jgi:hypothetical protein
MFYLGTPSRCCSDPVIANFSATLSLLLWILWIFILQAAQAQAAAIIQDIDQQLQEPED